MMVRRLILVIATACIVAACTTQPIRNINEEPIPTSLSGKTLDVEDVRAAILLGARNKNWSARVVSPGLIEAAITVRSHRAIVEIPYTALSYSIIYKSSENLDSNNGVIHRNYNRWVLNLSASIQRQLNVL
jgi:hypothetical protein